MSVKIVYEGVALQAKEDSSFSTENEIEFSDVSKIKENVDIHSYGTLEKNQFILDGTYGIMPDDKSGCALWSNTISDTSGDFISPLSLTVSFSKYYSSAGLTLSFTDDYCNEINIKWYQNDTLLSDKDFQPDSLNYFCYNRVENYNLIEIIFKKTSKPQRYAKISHIEFGVIKEFTNDELINSSVMEEIDPIGAEISINTMDFSFNSENIEYMFEMKQPFKIYYNDELLGTYFLEKSNRISKNRYSVETYDYMGILDKNTFMGGMYSGEYLYSVIDDIFENTNVPYEIDSKIRFYSVYGHIPVCSAKEALVYICFAFGCNAVTAKRENVYITLLDNEVKRNIQSENVYSGGRFENNDMITSVCLTEHNYKESDEIQELYNGTDEEQTVIFNEPMWDLSITGGKIIKRGTNYAVIRKTGETMVLTGKKYVHQTNIHSKSLNILNSTALVNEMNFESCTLIHKYNYSTVLNRLYNYYVGKKDKSIFKAKSDVENVGDVITYDTLFLGNKKGRILSKKYTLNTNNIAAEYTVEDVN